MLAPVALTVMLRTSHHAAYGLISGIRLKAYKVSGKTTINVRNPTNEATKMEGTSSSNR
jgi:hypothetical protein